MTISHYQLYLLYLKIQIIACDIQFEMFCGKNLSMILVVFGLSHKCVVLNL